MRDFNKWKISHYIFPLFNSLQKAIYTIKLKHQVQTDTPDFARFQEFYRLCTLIKVVSQRHGIVDFEYGARLRPAFKVEGLGRLHHLTDGGDMICLH